MPRTPIALCGIALLLAIVAVASGRADDKTLLATLQAKLEKADAEIAKQDWKAANELLNEALTDLGNRYYDPNVIDDSGMHLVAANMQEKEGKPDNAARNRRRILDSRMEMLREKNH